MPQNFIECDREQVLLMPPSLRGWLPEDHLSWFVLAAARRWICRRSTRPTGTTVMVVRRTTRRWWSRYWSTRYALGRRSSRGRLKGRGERVRPNPGLRFGDAADAWLGGQVADLRPATQQLYRSAVETHLRPRWGRRRLDAIGVEEAATLVRELRAAGKSEWTIAAEDLFTRAQRANERMDAPFLLARTHLSWGRMLTERGDPGDPDRASEHLGEALLRARRFDCAWIEREAGALAAA